MRNLSGVLLALLAGPAMAATTATVTPGPWNLYRGTSIVSPRVDYTSEAACITGARSINVTRNYTCRTSTGVAVTYTADPPPAPVNCVVSTWTETPGNWSACTNGTRTRQITRTRSIVTQPANGGQACPVLGEMLPQSEPCTVAPPATTAANQCWSPPLNAYRVCANGVTVQARSTAGNFGDWSGGVSKLWQSVAANEAVYVCTIALPIGAGDGCPTPRDASAKYVLKSSLTGIAPVALGTASLRWEPENASSTNFRVEYGRGDFATQIPVPGLSYFVRDLPAGQWQFRVIEISNGNERPSNVVTKVIR